MNDSLNENLENNLCFLDLCSSRKLVESDVLSARKQANENIMLKNSPPFRPGGRASRQLVKAIEMSLADKAVSSDVDGNEPQFVIFMGENPCFAKLILRTAGSVLIEPMHPDPLDNSILQPWNGHVKIVEGNDVYQVQMRKEHNGWKVTDSLRLRGILSSFLSKYKLSSLPPNLGNVKCLNNVYDDGGPSDPLDLMSLEDGSDDCNSTESSLFSMLKKNSSTLTTNFDYSINKSSQKASIRPEQFCFSPTSNDKLKNKSEISRPIPNEVDNRRNSIKFFHQPFRSTIIRTPSPQPHVIKNSQILSATTVALETPPVMKSDDLHQNMLAKKRENNYNYSDYDVSTNSTSNNNNNNNNNNNSNNNIPIMETIHMIDRCSPLPHRNYTELIDTHTNIITTMYTISEQHPLPVQQQQQQQQSQYSIGSPIPSITPIEYFHQQEHSIPFDVLNQSDNNIKISNTTVAVTVTSPLPLQEPVKELVKVVISNDHNIENIPEASITSQLFDLSEVSFQQGELTSNTNEIVENNIIDSADTNNKLIHFSELEVNDVMDHVPPLPFCNNTTDSNYQLDNEYNNNSNNTCTTTNITFIPTTSSTLSIMLADVTVDAALYDVSNSSNKENLPTSSSTSTLLTLNKDNYNTLVATPDKDELIKVDSSCSISGSSSGGTTKKRKRKLDIDFNVSSSSSSCDESAMPPRPPRASNINVKSRQSTKLGLSCNETPSAAITNITTSTLSDGISSLPRPPLSSKKKGGKVSDSTSTTNIRDSKSTKNTLNINNDGICQSSYENQLETVTVTREVEPPLATRSSSRKRSNISPMQRDAIFGQWVSRYQAAATGSWQL